jgi:hypothetical protein
VRLFVGFDLQPPSFVVLHKFNLMLGVPCIGGNRIAAAHFFICLLHSGVIADQNHFLEFQDVIGATWNKPHVVFGRGTCGTVDGYNAGVAACLNETGRSVLNGFLGSHQSITMN